MIRRLYQRIRHPWARLWMRFSGLGPLGRIATRFASFRTPPYKERRFLANLSKRGYVSPTASVHCPNLKLGNHVFIGDRVTLYESHNSAGVTIGDRVCIHQDGIIEAGQGGGLSIGAGTQIQPRLQLSAYKGSVTIGRNVQIAPNCAFYPYDHSFHPGESINRQPLQTKGEYRSKTMYGSGSE